MRLFKEINWGLNEIRRYNSKYGLHISRLYLEKILGDSVVSSDNDIVLNMLDYGFITVENEGIRLTEFGDEMMSDATDRYELSVAQKKFAAQIYINKNMSIARNWFALFSLGTLYFKREVINLSLQQFTEDMIELAVASQEKDLVYLNKEYTSLLQNFINKGMTEEELFKVLEKNKQLGDKAEKIALEFEKNRLTMIGRPDLAKKVKLIAKSDVTAGYDIKSFQEVNSEVDDAFIEVKSFTHNHFYLSENELKTSEILKEDYYLYLVNSNTGDIRIVNNPFANLEGIAKESKPVCIKYTF